MWRKQHEDTVLSLLPLPVNRFIPPSYYKQMFVYLLQQTDFPIFRLWQLTSSVIEATDRFTCFFPTAQAERMRAKTVVTFCLCRESIVGVIGSLDALRLSAAIKSNNVVFQLPETTVLISVTERTHCTSLAYDKRIYRFELEKQYIFYQYMLFKSEFVRLFIAAFESEQTSC